MHHDGKGSEKLKGMADKWIDGLREEKRESKFAEEYSVQRWHSVALQLAI